MPDMMNRTRALSFFLLLTLVSTFPARAELDVFGYAGVLGPKDNHLSSITSQGIRLNIATIDFPSTWTEVNVGALDQQLRSVNARGALFLDHVLFRKELVAASPCVDEQGPFVFRLRGNWRDRLGAFATANGQWISTDRTAFLVIFGEINNACVPMADVELAAVAVKQKWPVIPTVIGFGRSPGAKPQPAYIPAAIDWVGFYKYGTYDPADPAHPYNADDQYLVEYQALAAKLATHQKILLVFDGWWGEFLHSHLNSHRGPGTGWPQWYLSNVAVNYERFARSEARVVGLLSFLWPSTPTLRGTVDLPQSVRDQHRAITCRMSGC
jgi:hypothetical protein